mmetsp:Transcript_5390/g.9355  ORF Transcript_5390/g.9355 Transcript_5390/m.9355 type:complete len:194 (-) Transcript_5390:845-1426(-)
MSTNRKGDSQHFQLSQISVGKKTRMRSQTHEQKRSFLRRVFSLRMQRTFSIRELRQGWSDRLWKRSTEKRETRESRDTKDGIFQMEEPHHVDFNVFWDERFDRKENHLVGVDTESIDSPFTPPDVVCVPDETQDQHRKGRSSEPMVGSNVGKTPYPLPTMIYVDLTRPKSADNDTITLDGANLDFDEFEQLEI